MKMNTLDMVKARYSNEIIKQFEAFRKAICDCHDAESAKAISNEIDEYCNKHDIALKDRPDLLDGYGEMLAMLMDCVPETEEEKRLLSMSSEELDHYFREKYPEAFKVTRLFDD